MKKRMIATVLVVVLIAGVAFFIYWMRHRTVCSTLDDGYTYVDTEVKKSIDNKNFTCRFVVAFLIEKVYQILL